MEQAVGLTMTSFLAAQVLHTLLDRSQGTEGQLVSGSAARQADTEEGSNTEADGVDSDAGPSSSARAKPAAQRSRLGPRDVQPPPSPARSCASQPATSSTPCQLHSLLCAYYLACGLVGRCAELVSLMDQPRTGSLTRPIPQHVIQVRSGAGLVEH